MMAAVYARKSTADQDGTDTEQKSVARQIDNARAFAVSRGWAVQDRHAYSDDAKSGAKRESWSTGNG
jgi:DNA invertase Pin-like site-specific DNA recombinase